MPRHLYLIYCWLSLNAPNFKIFTAKEIAKIPITDRDKRVVEPFKLIRKYIIRR
jgi:hypothetical protein